jgi:hypothetical protein
MNKGIAFFIGLLLGIMICVGVFYLNSKKIQQVISFHTNKEVVTRIQTDTVFVETAPKFKKQIIEELPEDALIEDIVEEEMIEEDISGFHAEFSYGDETDEVFFDQLLKTRTVKVKLLQQEKTETTASDNFLPFFEIQQWSTPIKNRIAYYRDQNMLKIKGMKIDNMNIFFWNDDYYLETENRYYAIPETKSYDKMVLTRIP